MSITIDGRTTQIETPEGNGGAVAIPANGTQLVVSATVQNVQAGFGILAIWTVQLDLAAVAGAVGVQVQQHGQAVPAGMPYNETLLASQSHTYSGAYLFGATGASALVGLPANVQIDLSIVTPAAVSGNVAANKYQLILIPVLIGLSHA